MILTILIVIVKSSAYSQGFDWQYSARFPASSPTFFIGISGEGDYLRHYGKLNFAADLITCCTFKSGEGTGYSTGIKFEKWLGGDFAYWGGLDYFSSPGTFRISNQWQRISDTLIEEYRFESKLTYICGEAGMKYRLAGTHFFAAGSLRFGLLINNNSAHFEKVYTTSGAPPSYDRQMTEGKISDLYNFYITPRFRLGWDFKTGLGKYASIYSTIGFPVMDVAQTAIWRCWNLSAGVTFWFGVK